MKEFVFQYDNLFLKYILANSFFKWNFDPLSLLLVFCVVLKSVSKFKNKIFYLF